MSEYEKNLDAFSKAVALAVSTGNQQHWDAVSKLVLRHYHLAEAVK